MRRPADGLSWAGMCERGRWPHAVGAPFLRWSCLCAAGDRGLGHAGPSIRAPGGLRTVQAGCQVRSDAPRPSAATAVCVSASRPARLFFAAAFRGRCPSLPVLHGWAAAMVLMSLWPNGRAGALAFALRMGGRRRSALWLGFRPAAGGAEALVSSSSYFARSRLAGVPKRLVAALQPFTMAASRARVAMRPRRSSGTCFEESSSSAPDAST